MKSSKVGRKIKQYREESQLTQQDLADKIGVTWEMISRYERGINEPYNRIEIIAKALNTNISELLQDNNIANFQNNIPLFTKAPKNLDFSRDNTTFYYVCPEWIFQKDKGAFAIDMNLIEKNNDGVYYISPNTKPKEKNLVLINKKNNLTIEKFQKQNEILGTVLSFEKRVF